MLHRNRSILSIAVLAALALVLASCGGDDDSGSDTQAAATDSATAAAATGDTVSVQTVSGAGDVLVDSQGKVLYTNDRDRGAKVACTGECTGIWVPLEAPSGGQPTSGDSSVESALGVVERPDGTSQVTFDGKPLYSFVQDGPGEATGDGLADSFGGTEFVWLAARAEGVSAGTGAAATSTGGGETTTAPEDSGSGGYGY